MMTIRFADDLAQLLARANRDAISFYLLVHERRAATDPHALGQVVTTNRAYRLEIDDRFISVVRTGMLQYLSDELPKKKRQGFKEYSPSQETSYSLQIADFSLSYIDYFAGEDGNAISRLAREMDQIVPLAASLDGLLSPEDSTLLEVKTAGYALSCPAPLEDGEDSARLLLFRQLSTSQSLPSHRVVSTSKESSSLTFLERESIIVDGKVDFAYYDGGCYIFNKRAFERLVDMEAAYREEALRIVDELEAMPLFGNLKTMKALIAGEMPEGKKLAIEVVNRGRIIDMDTLSSASPSILTQIGQSMRIHIPRNERHQMEVRNDDEAMLLLKIASDYFKAGLMSGQSYGTYSGKKIGTTDRAKDGWTPDDERVSNALRQIMERNQVDSQE